MASNRKLPSTATINKNSLRSCPCSVSLTPWPNPYSRFINYSLLLLHLHTSPFVLVSYCLFPSNKTTGSNDQIHCRHPDYVRSTCARTSYPTWLCRLPSGTPSPVYAAKPGISYSYSWVFHRCVPTALSKCMLLLPYDGRLSLCRIIRIKSHR